MKVWRIARAHFAETAQDMLNGHGARRVGGRWTPRGLRAVYCAETSSLAALEVLVHLADPADFKAHRILWLDVPDELLVVPAGSTDRPQSLGAELLAESLGFIVPSAVNSLERTIVINPEHAQFDRISIGEPMPFILDQRLTQTK